MVLWLHLELYMFHCSLVVGDFMLQVIGRSILIISENGKGVVQVDKPQHKKEGSEDLRENS